MSKRHYTPVDRWIQSFDSMLNMMAGSVVAHDRRSPATDKLQTKALTLAEKNHSIGLMRINHTGEVCAQALYQGQAVTSQSYHLKAELEHAKEEEIDHLAWCADRLQDLGGRASVLNPVWYFGALTMGMIAGTCGDEWNLGFVAETEHQVEEHLHRHLERLPEHDTKSRAVLEQMKIDEAAHAAMAEEHGARQLPWWIQKIMTLTADSMKQIAYYL